MKKIENIEIKNFKSIRHAEIKDCRRINVFIGYPNTGKSNILEALGLFGIDDDKFDFKSFLRIENFSTIFFDGNVSSSGEITINNIDQVFLKLLETDELLYLFQFCETGFGKKSHSSGEKDNIISQIFFKVAHEGQKIIDFSKEKIYKKKEHPFIKKYLYQRDFLNEKRNFESLSYPYGNNIFSIISTNESLRKEIVNLFKQYELKFLFDKETQLYRILKFLKDDQIFTIPYSLIADTLQRLIFYKAAIASNKDSILLFEEPEAHMFPPYISKFTGDIMYDKNNNQYFIATHSPFVLNDFMEDLEKEELAIYAVGYKKETGETTIHRLTNEQVTEVYQYGVDLFFNLEDYLKDAVS